MDYGDIVGRGWRITWNNKFLWVLGFFAALARGGSSFSNSSRYSNSGPVNTEQLVQMTAILITVICLLLIIGLVLWLISLVAKGGLISAVVRIDAGENVSLGEAFSAGTAKLGSLVGMNLILYLPFILVIGIAVGVMITFFAGSGAFALLSTGEPSEFADSLAAGFGIFFLCLCGLICGLVIVGVFLQFINAFAFRGIMLQDIGAIESISHGWQVFRQNLGEVLILSLLFLVIGIVYSILVSFIILPMTLILVIPMIVSISTGSFGMLELLFLIGGGIAIGLIAAALNAILTTWQSASFTLAYQEWLNKPKTA